MKEIHLSRSSESVFRIIQDLYDADKAHCLGDMILRVSDTEIETGDGNLFILGEGGDDHSDAGDYSFGRDGASWFRALRDTSSAGVDTGNRVWIKFIEDVSRRFHDKYSFLEYFHDKTKAQAANETTDRAVIEALCRQLGITYTSIDKAEGDVNYIFFGVTLKLMLNKNGFFQPILAKLLFSNGRPMKAEGAQRILRSLTTEEGTSDARRKNRVRARENREYKLEEVNNLLTMFFEDLKQEGNLMDYLILNSDEDTRIIRQLEGYDASSISCDSVKMLNLFYADWPSRGYDIIADETPLFRFMFGPGDLLSLVCNCGDVIISDNIMLCHNPDTEEDVELTLDIAEYRHSFGLDPDELAFLTAHCPTKDHAIPVFCRENIRVSAGCKRYRCRHEAVSFDATGRLYCADCPYPEVISYVDGKPCLTADLVYSTNSRRLTRRDAVMTCSVCNRPFDNLAKGETVCSVCRSLSEDVMTPGSVEEKRAKTLFRAYSHMLPLSGRLFTTGPRLCAEDEQIVLFRLGTKNYMYDKRTGAFRRLDT